jgi:hypothetical protein
MKFELTTEYIEIFGRKLFRIRALVDFGEVKKSDLGGYIEKDGNLSQVSGDAWVSGDAQVYGDARVSGDAQVYGDARVSGDARVYGDAWVYGSAWVYGDAQVSGSAWVSGDASKSPSNIIGLRYNITITDDIIQIGCEKHTINEWSDFDDRAILKMDGKESLDWWKKYKPFIMQICDERNKK